MNYPEYTPARTYDRGMGEAVANRTVNRKIVKPVIEAYQQPIILPRRDDVALDDAVAAWCKSNKVVISGYEVTAGDDQTVEITLTVSGNIEIETWADVAHRVAIGSSLLRKEDQETEYAAMHHHLRQASLLMSGRHLQHGDDTQPSRNMEVFTNCATSGLTCLEFYLLLNGSGVGRCYDDAMMQVDWRLMPTVAVVINQSHPDVQSGEIVALDYASAQHLYAHKQQIYFKVPDSREGWAQAIEKLEVLTFEGCNRNAVLFLDFSDVRHRGSPIGGMQDRPASGPGPLMNAIFHVAKLREANMEPWRATMFADHYFAECVLVGGARRAARMATKSWRDIDTIFGFIQLKRGGFLWTSNNSVTVDMEFWDAVKKLWSLKEEGKTIDTAITVTHQITPLELHAWKVFQAVCEAAYYDGTGEPGFITVDKLVWDDTGIEELVGGDFAESFKYKLMDDTRNLTRAVAQAWRKLLYKVITNPCGEIVLAAIGGYCVIADVVPFHAGSYLDGPSWQLDTKMSQCEAMAEVERIWDEDAEDAMRVATRALIRTNLMDSMYAKEVKRTNRIGVGMTGLHEYAWARFGFGFRDLIDEDKAKDFWLMLSRFKRAVQDEAAKYSAALGVVCPHTDTTMKPAGTTSKLFGLTEGAHLATMREYLRWVQFRYDDPLVQKYEKMGYPVRHLKVYQGTSIVGFPTAPTICTLGMGDKLVTAGEATPGEQYQFLRLMEKYWIVGVAEDGVTPLRDTGNQVSYTLKYDPKSITFDQFMQTLLDGQSTIRCCSVMPQTDATAYEYQPEEPVTKAQFELICQALKTDIEEGDKVQEDVGQEHVDCATGACPISFGDNVAA
jgi:hypothetical protein